jgi:hypothetical protein
MIIKKHWSPGPSCIFPTYYIEASERNNLISDYSWNEDFSFCYYFNVDNKIQYFPNSEDLKQRKHYYTDYLDENIIKNIQNKIDFKNNIEDACSAQYNAVSGKPRQILNILKKYFSRIEFKQGIFICSYPERFEIIDNDNCHCHISLIEI